MTSFSRTSRLASLGRAERAMRVACAFHFASFPTRWNLNANHTFDALTVPLLAMLSLAETLRDNANDPLDSPILSYLPLVALLFAASHLLPPTPPLIPAFINEDEASKVAERRRQAIERRTGRDAEFSDVGLASQKRKFTAISAVATVEMVAWAAKAGFNLDWKRGGATSLTWVSAYDCSHDFSSRAHTFRLCIFRSSSLRSTPL